MASSLARASDKVLVARAHLAPGGIFDQFGNELTHAHHLLAIRDILGEPLMKLIAHAKRLQDQPDHPIHQDLAEAAHARLAGTWRVDRYDAPIEWYAAQLPEVKNHLGLSEAQIAAAGIQSLPPSLRAQADALLKRDKRPSSSEWEDTFENLFMTQGVSALWNQAANGGAANTSGASPSIDAWYNNAQAIIGVGDSTTAAAATQFDLQAATNREWIGMDATFPTLPGTGSNQIVFRSTFGTSQGNYAWQEFAVANDNGSNVTIPGSAARSASHGSMLDRVVSSQGTKASGQTWQPSLTLSIS